MVFDALFRSPPCSTRQVTGMMVDSISTDGDGGIINNTCLSGQSRFDYQLPNSVFKLKYIFFLFKSLYTGLTLNLIMHSDIPVLWIYGWSFRPIMFSFLIFVVRTRQLRHKRWRQQSQTFTDNSLITSVQ